MRLCCAGECASYTSENRFRAGGDPVWGLVTVTRCRTRPAGVAPPDLRGPGHRRPQTGRGRSARGARSATAGWCGRRGTSVGLGPADRPDRVGRSRRWRPVGYSAAEFGTTPAWWYERLHAEDRERVVSGMHARDRPRGRANGPTSIASARQRRPLHAGADRAGIVRDRGGRSPSRMAEWPGAEVTDRTRARVRWSEGQSRLLERIAAGRTRSVLEAFCGSPRHTEATARLPHAARAGRRASSGWPPPRPSRPRSRTASARSRSGRRWGERRRRARHRRGLPDLADDPLGQGRPRIVLARGIRACWSVPQSARRRCCSAPSRTTAASRGTHPPKTLRIVEHRQPPRGIAIERYRNQSRRSPGVTRLLQQVLETLPVGVWVVDRAGHRVRQRRGPGSIWGGARYVGIDGFGAFKGWGLESGEADRAGRVGGGRAPSARRDLAQRAGPDPGLRRRRSGPSSTPRCRSPVAAAASKGAIVLRSGHHRAARRARRRCAGARSSSARRRRWRRSAGSPAASPTTSTTCSPSS